MGTFFDTFTSLCRKMYSGLWIKTLRDFFSKHAFRVIKSNIIHYTGERCCAILSILSQEVFKLAAKLGISHQWLIWPATLSNRHKVLPENLLASSSLASCFTFINLPLVLSNIVPGPCSTCLHPYLPLYYMITRGQLFVVALIFARAENIDIFSLFGYEHMDKILS